MLHNVCTCTATLHYDLTLYLLNAFGADIGDTQIVSNISNMYLEQIHAYLDCVFGIMILHGKHPKTNWHYYVAYSADKGTVGEANQLMIGAGFRDASEYRWIMLECKDAYHQVTSQPNITFKQGYLVVESICERFNLTASQF